MREELGDIPEFVGLQSVDRFVLFSEHVLEWLYVLLVNHTKPLKNKQYFTIQEILIFVVLISIFTCRRFENQSKHVE